MTGHGYEFAGGHLGVNVAYTKFFFVTPTRDDDLTHAKVREAGGDACGQEWRASRRRSIRAADLLEVPPRLKETELELRRRLAKFADVTSLKGAVRVPQYTSAEMYAYYNPDGHGRPGEWDFVTYFECADEHLDTFDQVCRALRDVRQNPEWRYVTEGLESRGRRVLKW